MKRLNFISLLFIFFFSTVNCFGQSTDSISYPVVYQIDSISSNPIMVIPDRNAPELLLENIWIPDEDGGAMPIDIIHIATPTQDKIYVYGKRRIVVYDGDTYDQIATINISAHSQYAEERYSSENYFVYNEEDHLLYCTTENLELIAIDTETDDAPILIAERPGNLQNDEYYATNFLMFDNNLEQIYWVISQSSSGSNLYILDANEPTPIVDPYTEEFDDAIFDIEINESRSEYYLSIGNEFRVYDANAFELKTNISNGANETGDFLRVNDNGVDKLFCFTRVIVDNPNSNVHVIDFNDGSSVSSFQQPAATETACYYNPNTHFVYVGLQTANDLWVFDPGNYNTIANIDTHVSYTGIDGGAPLEMTNLSEKVIIGKEHEIVIVDETDYAVESIKQGFNNIFFRTINANGKAFTIGANIGTLDVIKQLNSEIIVDQTMQIGAEVYLGCYNTIEHKAYYYTAQYIDNSNVYILNALTNAITIVEVGSNISDLVFSEEENKVLVSTTDGSEHIKLIDGETDELLNSYIPLGYQFFDCISMFLAPNNKLYCILRDGSGAIEPGTLVVYDAANGYTFLAKHNYNDEKVYGEFCYNPTNGNIYATARNTKSIQNGILTEVNGMANTFSHFGVDESSHHIVCNPHENKILISYFVGYNQHLTVFDCNNSTLSQLTLDGTTSIVYDLAYDSHNQFVYALHDITGLGRVSIIQDDVEISTLRVPEYSISLKYNTNNYNLYVYVPHDAAMEFEGELWEFQIFVNENGGITDMHTRIPLLNKQAYKLGGFLMNHDMLIDPVLNRLYVANAAFSNISVIEMPEILVLDGQSNKNYKWLSFPRLERLNNNAVAVQTVLGGERIVPNDYINQSELQYLMPGSLPQQLASNFYQNGEWQDNAPLDEIKSSLGYKLNLKYDDPYPDNNYLQLYGAVLDPTENVVVYEDNENWVGYWLYEEQSPFDAIPENVLDNLTLIKTQDWLCVKEWVPSNSMLIPIWVCAVHIGDDLSLEYADMVILESNANNDINFQWQSGGTSASSGERGDTEHYQYNEQADYTAYIIELDSTENPEEIAAFIGDSCVGASKVLASDTNVLVPGYIEGMEGDVVFEEYYGSQKSAKPTISTYFVNNNQSRTWEKRTIHTDERKGHYLISFKNRKEENLNNSEVFSNIWPNPATGTLFYNIKAGTGAVVTISIFDIAGKLMTRPVNETMESGSLTGEFKLTDMQGNKLKPGIYFVKIKAGQMLETKKVIVK